MSVVSLADVKAHLNIAVTTYDVELQAFIDAAEAWLSTQVGPVSVQSAVTARISGSTGQLVLPEAPINSVTAITSPDGQSLDLTKVTVNKAAGIAYYTDDVTGFGFDAYDVTYTAGWTSLPANLVLAVKEKVRQGWTSQRGGSPRAGGGPDLDATMASGSFVDMLIEPYRQPRIGAC